MPKLKPWYDVVELREDLRENRPLDASEFAVHLDQIRDGRAPKDYTDPQRFFERTYVTGSLLDLASQVLRRLSGIQVETSAVFNMSTQFGGGKSHSLTALYHLARNGEKARNWSGVSRILTKGAIDIIPEASVAVFVGTEFDPISGRGAEGEPKRKTIWGEIAWQLGKQDSFRVVAEHDEEGVAPGGEVIRAMLPETPVLILMDELLNFASRGRKLGVRDQLVNFLQNLTEEARGRKNLVLCVALPQSHDTEMNPDDIRDFEAMKKLLDRVGKAIMMSADTEISEIIRRRLFDWSGMPQEGKQTSEAYADWAIEHAQELTGFDPDTVRDRFQTAYPFHPTVLSVFERKWQSLPRFQRTRGILRLLALWVARNVFEEKRMTTRAPLITLGLAPLEDPIFRAALFEQLGSSELEIPVATDIIGRTGAHAERLDKEASDAIKKGRLHRKVATTIFFESNGGMSQSKADASVPEIRTGVFGPDSNLADLEIVLEGLTSTCYYLNWDRNRYRFGLSPNLNQILVTRRGAVSTKSIEDRIRQQTEILFKKNSTEACKRIERKYSPASSSEIKNLPVLTLVVFGIDSPAGEKQTSEKIETIVRECGSSGRTFKSALLFTAPQKGDEIRDAARNALAWEDIDDDEETKKRIDESQKNLLDRNLRNARRDLDEALFRSYRMVYLLGSENKMQPFDLGQITSSSAGSIVELILRELLKTEQICEGIIPNKLVKFWPPSLVEWSTKSVRDAFYSSPQLPRIINPDAIKRTVSDGVAKGAIGYATKLATGQLKLERFAESLSESEVEISDEAFIVTAEVAKKLVEPPRLTTLLIRPAHVVLKQGEQSTFSCDRLDQYGHPIEVTAISWESTGGEMTDDGRFTSGTSDGVFIVRARAGERTATAEVRVRSATEPIVEKESGSTEPKPSAGVIRWRGSVPTQKWMNFYTKVLTKFASVPGLKLEVTFEVPLPPEQLQAKADEANSGLKELGLVNLQEP